MVIGCNIGVVVDSDSVAGAETEVSLFDEDESLVLDNRELVS